MEAKPSTAESDGRDPDGEASRLGRLIRAERRRAGQTQAAMAAAIKVSQPTLSVIEGGKPTAQVGLVLRACRHLKIDLGRLGLEAGMVAAECPEARQTSPKVPRSRVIGRIEASEAPIVLLEGWAGTGKSTILASLAARGWQDDQSRSPDAPRLLLDANGDRDLPMLAPGQRLVVARRPGTPVGGLARTSVYGLVERIGMRELLFAEEELRAALGPVEGREAWERSGGWAAFLGMVNANEAEHFLEEEVLARTTAEERARLEGWLGLGNAGAPEGLEGWALPEAIRVPFQAALRRSIKADLGASDRARALAAARRRARNPPGEIAALQRAGAWSAALRALDVAGGPLFGHRYGPDALTAAVDGFPSELAQADETLVLCRAVQATRRGEVLAAHRILVARWGPAVLHAPEFVGHADRHGLPVRFYRFLLQTWEDFEPDAAYLDRAYGLLAELPADDELMRGAFYNAVLEVYIRARRFAEAEAAAIRASAHYARAGVPIMSAYVDLHRGIVRLFEGEPNGAAHHARAARAHLERVPFAAAGEARLINLLDACVAFEAGRPAALVQFLGDELDAFAAGEVWPSLVELALTYGSQAVADHHSTAAARLFLDRFRLLGSRVSQYRRLIDLREVELLQRAGRWDEAGARLGALSPPRSPEDGGLPDRDVTTWSLLALRQRAHLQPGAALVADLDRAIGDRHLTARQRAGAELWLAHALRRSGHAARAAGRLVGTLDRVAATGCVALLGEERLILADLMGSARVRAAVAQSDAARRALRRLREAGAVAGRSAGLTRQEARVLRALCEGLSTKAVARLLGLAEPTVKFHLRNLYRKLGCRSRAEARAAAAALGLTPR